MRLILNVIWLVLCGWWMAILYFLAGIVCFILIITIPFGIAAWRIAGYVLWPFGRSVVMRRDFGAGALIGNIIWIVLVGWELALGHLTPYGRVHEIQAPVFPICGSTDRRFRPLSVHRTTAQNTRDVMMTRDKRR
jgi:uncharacterized membrane protein YccF (DUF307 family)